MLALGCGTLPESILESPGKRLHVPHATGSFRATTLGLGVVKATHLRSREPTASASLLLDVVGHLTATTATSV